MGRLNSIDVQDLASRLTEEAQLVVSTLNDRGAKYFMRPLLAALTVVVFCYVGVYSPTMAKRLQVRERVAAERAKARHASDYEKFEVREKELFERVVPYSEKDGWLFNKILETAQKEGISLDSIGSQEEERKGDMMALTVRVKSQLTFPQLGRWVARLENSPVQLRVAMINIEKEKYKDLKELEENLGRNKVQVGVKAYTALKEGM